MTWLMYPYITTSRPLDLQGASSTKFNTMDGNNCLNINHKQIYQNLIKANNSI